jgi:hypothetical protein
MKKFNIPIRMAVVMLMLAGMGACQKREETSNKLIDGLPVETDQTVVPMLALQQLHVLSHYGGSQIVQIINGLGLDNPVFPQLDGPDANKKYRLTLVEAHFGTAEFVIEFLDSSGTNAIDPIIQRTTETLKYVDVDVSGYSDKFVHTQHYRITLEIEGDTNSKKIITDQAGQTNSEVGSGINYTYSFVFPGLRCNYEGLLSGHMTGSGTGTDGNPINVVMVYSSNYDADGTLDWELQSGTMKLKHDGDAILVTNTSRIVFD